MSIAKREMLFGNSHASHRTMLVRVAATCLLASALTGCGVRNDRVVKVGQNLITDAKGNHPIRVAKQMVTMKVPVRRGDYGLNAEKKMELVGFVDRYRREGEGRLIISAPAGQPNETAAFEVLGDIRKSMKAQGIVRKMVKLKPYTPKGNPEAPIRISYLGYTAKGPKCGPLTRDAGGEDRNLPYENLSCASQANFAAMVANPKDLIEARGETPRSGERRDKLWGDYVSGRQTGSKKSADQKSKLSQAAGN